jgi:hypothetical protein
MTMNQVNGSSHIIPAHVLGSLRGVAHVDDDVTAVEEEDGVADEAAVGNEPAAREDDEEMFPIEEDDGRPTIELQKPLDRIVDRSVRLLAEEPLLFQKHGELVRVTTEEDGRVKLRPVKNVQVRYLLSQKAHWKKDGKPAHPPEHVAKCLVERTAWERIRILRAVTPFPAIDEQGNIPNEPGYDEHTRTYFTGEVEVQVSAAPSKEDAHRAVAILRDIVGDFPFANTESNEHFSAFLAGLLTPLARYAHDGNAPMVVVQANGPRIGKTTLVKVISEIISGVPVPVITFTKNEDETRKRLLSFLRVGRSMVLVDNVIGQFGGQNVNALTTSRTFEDRVLGKSVILEAVNDTSWYVTANNIMLAPDTAERCLNVRLHSEVEKPQLRADFKYPDLFKVVREKRADLLSAALTILKAFIVEGKPEQDIAAWGGFEKWSALVRGAVRFAGLPDPAKTRLELEEHADVETDDKAALVQALADWQAETGNVNGTKANDILAHLRANPETGSGLRAVLEDIAGMPGTLPNAQTFARHLRIASERNLGGVVLKRTSDLKNGHRWFVERMGGEVAFAPGG